MLSGHKNGTINAWNIVNKEKLKSFKEHKNIVDDVKALTFSYFVSCSKDQSIRIWDFTSNKSLKVFINESWTFCISHLKSYNSELIATGDDNKYIKIWNIESYKIIGKIPTVHQNGIGRLLHLNKIAPFNMILSSSNPDIKLWNLDNYKCLRTYKGHFDWVNALAYYKEDLFISGSGDSTIKVWSIFNEACVKTLSVHKTYVSSLLNLTDYAGEELIMTGTLGKSSKIVSMETDNILLTLDRNDSIYKMIATTNNGNLNIIGCYWGSKVIKIWGHRK